MCRRVCMFGDQECGHDFWYKCGHNQYRSFKVMKLPRQKGNDPDGSPGNTIRSPERGGETMFGIHRYQIVAEAPQVRIRNCE